MPHIFYFEMRGRTYGIPIYNRRPAVPALARHSRRFESCHSDQKRSPIVIRSDFICFFPFFALPVIMIPIIRGHEMYFCIGERLSAKSVRFDVELINKKKN